MKYLRRREHLGSNVDDGSGLARLASTAPVLFYGTAGRRRAGVGVHAFDGGFYHVDRATRPWTRACALKI